MVEDCTAAEAFLSCAANLPRGARNVVQWLVTGVDIEASQGLNHPVIEKSVGVLKAHACDQVSWGVERIRNCGAKLHEHGATATHPAHNLHVVFGGVIQVNFVLE